jgi:hypothetical protein
MSRLKKKISNRNFLSSLKFKFTLNRAPKVAFFANKANIPEITLGVAEQSNYLTQPIPIPGDTMSFGDFELEFLIDEDLSNYMEIQNWIRGLGFPETLAQIYDLQSDENSYQRYEGNDIDLYSDGTLFILNSNDVVNFQINFRRMFPYQLSTLNFDATNTDEEYFTAVVSFKYLMYNICDTHGNHLPKKYS